LGSIFHDSASLISRVQNSDFPKVIEWHRITIIFFGGGDKTDETIRKEVRIDGMDAIE